MNENKMLIIVFAILIGVFIFYEKSNDKSNESDSSGSNSKSHSENKSNKNNESKDNNDEEDDSSYRAPDGNDIVKLNKVKED